MRGIRNGSGTTDPLQRRRDRRPSRAEPPSCALCRMMQLTISMRRGLSAEASFEEFDALLRANMDHVVRAVDARHLDSWHLARSPTSPGHQPTSRCTTGREGARWRLLGKAWRGPCPCPGKQGPGKARPCPGKQGPGKARPRESKALARESPGFAIFSRARIILAREKGDTSFPPDANPWIRNLFPGEDNIILAREKGATLAPLSRPMPSLTRKARTRVHPSPGTRILPYPYPLLFPGGGGGARRACQKMNFIRERG
jgi:hypothetical protein